MTCILALEHDGSVFMGADSVASSEMGYMVRKDPKLFRLNKEIVVGFSGSYRMGQILHYHVTPPPHPKKMSVEEYMVRFFIHEVQAQLARHNLDQLEEGDGFIVGYKDQALIIENDFQVGRALNGMSAIGTGADVGIGSMRAELRNGTEPKKAIRRALKDAAAVAEGVGAPFVIVKV